MMKRIARMFGNGPDPASPRAPRVRLGVEALEDRAVPASFVAATAAELIACITSANATAEADSIALSPGTTYTLTAVDNRTDGPTGLPVIEDPFRLTIIGNGATIERSSANGTPVFRLFDVAVGASLALEDLTLQGGVAVPYEGAAKGGAVLNLGHLSLTGVTVRNNTAQAYGYGQDAYGGGVYSDGSLTVTDATIQSNAARGGEGSHGGWLDTWGGGKFYQPGGDGGSALGGGIHIAGGPATITNTSITGNIARGGNGGSPGGDNGDGIGGGVYIAPAAGVALDLFTRDHVKKNSASTSDPDISGTYTLI